MNSLKWIIPIILVAIVFGVGVWAIYKAQTGTIDINEELNNTSQPGFGQQATPTATPSSSPKVMGTSAPGTQPATGTDELEIKNAGIQVVNPSTGQQITSGIKVTGRANVTSQKVIVTIKDANGTTLGSGTAKACIGLDACPFETTISFSQQATSTGTVEVYSPSTIDGSPTYLQIVAVTF